MKSAEINWFHQFSLRSGSATALPVPTAALSAGHSRGQPKSEGSSRRLSRLGRVFFFGDLGRVLEPDSAEICHIKSKQGHSCQLWHPCPCNLVANVTEVVNKNTVFEFVNSVYDS